MTPAVPAARSGVRRSLRSLAVLAVFSIAGPALGGLLAYAAGHPLMVLLGLGNSSTFVEGDSPLGQVATLGPLVLFVAAGYAFGGAQALLTGLAAALATWRTGTLSATWTAIAAVVPTLLWIALLYSPLNPLDVTDPTSNKLEAGVQIAVGLMPIGVVAALLCRWLCRTLRLIGADEP